MAVARAAKAKGSGAYRMKAKGRGAYKTVRTKTRNPRARGRGAYTSMGGRIGSSIGGFLGNAAHSIISKAIGFGDYAVSSNSLMGGLYNPPELQNLRDRSVVMRHREYIGDIVASTNFAIQEYAIQPGLDSSFPWLAQVASAFEEYYITGLIYEYKSLSADYTTASSASLGYVIMATQYNALNAAFTDKKTMENYEFANSAKPSDCFIHPVECKRSANPVSELYVRTGAVPAGQDARLYDLGSFQIATGGNAGQGILGELWATYEVVLRLPKLDAADGFELLSDHFNLQTVTNAAPLGTTSIADGAFNTLGTVIGATGLTITFPTYITNGSYMVAYTVRGGATAVTVSVVTPNSSCAFQQVWASNSLTSVNTPGGTTSALAVINILVTINTQNNGGAAAVLTFGAATLPTSVTSGDLWIMQVNNNQD